MVGVVELVEMRVNFGEEKEDVEMSYVEIEEGGGVFGIDGSGEESGEAVSYTHLTLPTIYSV